MTTGIKMTKTDARVSLVINGDLLQAVLNGATILEYHFNGWDWFVLVKLAKPDSEGFAFIQYESVDGIFHSMVQRNGSKRSVFVAFMKDYTETRQAKNKAFELGNIK